MKYVILIPLTTPKQSSKKLIEDLQLNGASQRCLFILFLLAQQSLLNSAGKARLTESCQPFTGWKRALRKGTINIIAINCLQSKNPAASGRRRLLIFLAQGTPFRATHRGVHKNRRPF